jgi:hypothetical protein
MPLAYVFDTRSGIRERLYLLSVLQDPHDAANWAYDPRRDVWSHVGGDELKVHSIGTQKAVKWEGSHSLEVLAKRGIDRRTAMEMIGYPER